MIYRIHDSFRPILDANVEMIRQHPETASKLGEDRSIRMEVLESMEKNPQACGRAILNYSQLNPSKSHEAYASGYREALQRQQA